MIEPGEKPSEQGREPTTNSIHIWRRVRESNPGHIGGRRALSPLRHPGLSEKSFVLFIQHPLSTLSVPSQHPLVTSSLVRPLTTAASRPNIFYPEVHEVDLWQVYQDGGDVTNPGGLSPCFLPRKCKSGPMSPSPGQKLASKVSKSRAIPPYVPGVNPPGWPLISA